MRQSSENNSRRGGKKGTREASAAIKKSRVSIHAVGGAAIFRNINSGPVLRTPFARRRLLSGARRPLKQPALRWRCPAFFRIINSLLRTAASLCTPAESLRPLRVILADAFARDTRTHADNRYAYSRWSGHGDRTSSRQLEV